jgi:NADH:ubiquinone oxidoreductase subunit K
MVLLGVFAALSITLTVVGLYGVMTYSTAIGMLPIRL